MPVHDLKDQLARLPEQPGVYLWVNAAGETIYVGKARSLRDRVRSYLGAYGLSPRHDALLDEIARVEVIVTDSVMEALVLETNLIKQRSPRYNILLRDDKNYPYLRLTTSEAFPRILVARSVEKIGRLLRRTVPASQAGATDDDAVASRVRHSLVQRGDHGTCAAARASSTTSNAAWRPCVAEICTEDQYGVAVANTRLLLEGTERRAHRALARSDAGGGG